MTVEQVGELEQRAAKHGALSDPSRLRIVDALSLGDLSPSDLQAMLGMPSNLVAHHLRVLQDVGLVLRHRSEADRRRTYLRLALDGLEGILPGSAGAASRVVFVCTANSARSQLAAALWRRTSPVPVTSAGTHPAGRVDPGATAVARKHDLALRATRPRSLDDVLKEDDYVITVCDNAHEELHNHDGLHWSVPDPVRVGTTAAFEATFDELDRRVADLAPRLAAS